MARKGYTIWIGSVYYHTKAASVSEARRNAAWSHRNRGYDRDLTIEQIMQKTVVRS